MPSRVAPQDPLIERLRRATSISALVRFLHDELNWPVDLDAIDDAFYDYEPEELGIKPEHQVAIQSIKQLRPLTSGQPWGIFFVEFDRQKLPMVVLRRVLQGLSLRNREKDKGRQRWHARDLLFISSFGPANDREIALAHFTDETEHGDLPTLRVLGWDGADTNLALAQVATTLREHLRWPSDGDTPTGQQRWRERWSSAFRLRYREAVTTAKDLALALAYLARAIRTRANEVLAVEGPDGPLTKLFVAFKANLMADLSHDRFADMYAQTITYGLFAARVSRSSGGLVADDAALMIPSTNPFLQELLQDFLAASGRARAASRRGRGTGIDFDELGVNAVVEQLRAAPMDAVLVSFNNARPGDDPVIHFYEDFLKAYDRAMRVERGVFYTPRPVVQFIVRSVHEVLQTEFGIEDGLASTITWAQMRQRMPDLAQPEGTSPESAFVQILDPAVGTATFLVEAVDLIHGHMRSKWQKAGMNKAQQLDAWNTYVRDHLLTRLHGFELMMAPYAIAHMKLGLKLADTGYRFPDGGPRLRVFLTNSLQPASEVQPQFELMAPMLAHEARAANVVKIQVACTVVLGNPPYSGISGNMFPWIDGLLKGRLPDGSIVQSYYKVDGKPLGEKKLWLQDDYVKFIRYGQWRIECSGIGVLGYITNHGYIDNPTFRGMRQCLMRTFSTIDVYDLHGNSNKKERAPDGSVDENVFDIEQGVAIALMRTSNISVLRQADLYGTRNSKYEALQGRIATQSVAPEGPNYFFATKDHTYKAEYERGWPLPLALPVHTSGIVTARDHLVIGLDTASLSARLLEFLDQSTTDDEIRQKMFAGLGSSKYPDGDTRGWKLPEARRRLRSTQWSRDIRDLLYRPFDVRKILYRADMVDWPRLDVMPQMTQGGNVGLITTAGTKDRWDVTCTSLMAGHKTCGAYDINYLFPLWMYTAEGERSDLHETDLVAALPSRVANLDPRFINVLREAMSLAEFDWHAEKQSAPLNAGKVFDYIYAVLHSPGYRQRYAPFLKIDFPRVPIVNSRHAFDALAALGRQLVQWHLLEHPIAAAITAVSQPGGVHAPSWYGKDLQLAKVADKARTLSDLVVSTQGPVGKVAVNATSGFADVLQCVWDHCVGGYQVLHKWLDDRRKVGRALSDHDIAHWRRIYVALQATQKLMLEVDGVIERHGGWPTGPGESGAFSLDHPPPSAEVAAAQAAARPRGRRRAAQPGQQSLLEGDDEPEPAPARPSAGPPTARTSSEDLDDGETMCALRSALGEASGPFTREDLVRAAARALRYSRTSAKLAEALDDAIRRAVRRGIAANELGALTLATRSIEDYERDALKTQVLAVVRAQRAWVPREDVPRLLARWLGFGRTGARIVEATESALRALVRSGDLQSQDGAVRPA